MQRVGIDRSPEERYEALVDSTGVIARRLEVAVEVGVRRLTGEVETSLYEAILGAGGDPDLVARVADLLAWDVDFFTDPRRGDRFDLLVEERWLDGQRLGGGPIFVLWIGLLGLAFLCTAVRAGHGWWVGVSPRKAAEADVPS